MSSPATAEQALLDRALAAASDTRLLVLEPTARFQTPAAFTALFGNAPAIVIADDKSFAAAGRDVVDALRGAGVVCREPIVLPADKLYAEYAYIDQLRPQIESQEGVPVAVGAGTINDLVKLAAHLCGRPYLVVATAASMDGYTAYGASITYHGSKQTFDCPAPRGVLADLDVIAAAPEGLNASGYADLAAKCPAGADWILADFLGEESIDGAAWSTVQSQLRYWMADPAGVRRRDLEALRRVTTALMMTGFAMQAARTSRCASGAEHQFSHLWDMEHHAVVGVAPSHGFKVGIGSLASTALYETLAEMNIEQLDVERAVAHWPDAAANEAEIAALFAHDELAAKAREESAIKLVDRDALRVQLQRLARGWPELHRRLAAQLFPWAELRDMLAAAGCPVDSAAIGISPDRLRRSYRQAYHIRRRFTVLDLAKRTGLMEPALERIFS
jgi:glycerol-1-phosphate dehydrogenase [NAD(P)+]